MHPKKDPELLRLKRLLDIEKATDKVSIVAMRMKHRADMLRICKTIAVQLEKLGVAEIRNVQTAIFYTERGTYMNYEYYLKHDKEIITETDFTNNKIHRDFASKMQKGKGSFMSKHIKGSKVKEWLAYQKTTNVFIDTFLKTASSLNYYWFSLGPVALGISTYKPLDEEALELFKKFLRVFELAYTRYLDIEKAEAQARESQIQLALERVRARTMAMQKSDELQEAASLMFQQVDSLGINTWSCGYNIFQKEDEEATSWMSNKGQMQPPFKVPLTELSTFVHFKTSKQKSEDFWTEELHGTELKAHYDYMLSLPGLEAIAKENKKNALEIPSRQINHIVNFSHGNLLFITYEQVPESHDIFKRFGKIFEQTYTRFLDLQKAEAQAREAQIEAALERVRSRSLAMHTSDELKDAIRMVLQQFIYLNIKVEHAGFYIDYKAHDDMHIWLADPNLEPFYAVIPYFDTPTWNSFLEAKAKGLILHTDLLDFKAKNKFYKSLFKLFKIPEEAKRFYLQCKGLAVSTVLLDNVGLYIENFSAIPYTEEENKILIRFGKVFQQTYTRFLDLKKAEEQARESQIQLALERVRARTIAMQKSEELGETASLLFQQVTSLGIKSYATGFTIWENNDQDLIPWMCNADGSVNPPFKMPAGEIEWHRMQYQSWKNKEDHIIYDFRDNEMKQHYKYLRSFPLLDEAFKKSEAAGVATPKRQIHNAFNFSHGNLLFITLEPVPGAYTIFSRFAKVFQQTYTRFLDLKKAEAQARESQIQLALERVRARTMAMQKSDELSGTAAVLFQQLIALAIAPNRLYIIITKENSSQMEAWVTDEDGSKVSMGFNGDNTKNETLHKMYTGWVQKKKTLIIDMQGEELQQYFHYLHNELKVPFKGGLDQKRRVQHIAYFSHGLIGMASPEEQPAETLELLERFANVFNLTFTRFNDLQIAEAHALQAEQDLIAIKVAKKKAEEALSELQATQKQLIQSEKMASLGELTAGIAHEIQNPLNFVNNFSEVSNELLTEMTEELDKGDIEEAKAIANDIQQNLQKINHHGKRADAIVKGMLQHSRTSSGQKELTDINNLCDEYIRLSYHGLRAKDKTFNAKFETSFDTNIHKINIVPQDIGRVILNLINNAFYAVNEKKKVAEGNYEPTVTISTKRNEQHISISVRDNGNGIPAAIKEKIFQPFFTTKPTGLGTGLGLSLSYDIVKAHNGEIKMETLEGEGTEFIIMLPATE